VSEAARDIRSDSDRRWAWIGDDAVSVLRLIFLIGLFFTFAYSAYKSYSFNPRAAYFPRAVGYFGATVVAIGFAMDVRSLRKTGTCVPLSVKEGTTTLGKARPGERWAAVRGVGRYLLWFVGYIGLVYVFGIFFATAIFVGSFLRLEAKLPWWKLGIGVGLLLFGMDQLGDAMNIRWPRAVIDLIPR